MRNIIDKFRLQPTEEAMRAVVDEACRPDVKDDDIAYLATTLGKSGRVPVVPGSRPTADLASTGAPTSLSTLLAPLYLRAMGCCVPKLGVPGRPAGGVDVLAQVPGYRVKLTNSEVAASIERCGYAHFLAGGEHAPLDARLFRFRQRSGTQSVPALVIASLLSKKIAVGLEHAGLDVRVAPHGNFGLTWDEARRNAERFQRVAAIVGVKAVCFLTDARFPYQPFIGRGEALVALKDTFSGSGEPALEQHTRLCFAMACGTTGQAAGDLDGQTKAAERHFYENLSAQGSSQEAFDEYVDRIRTAHRFHAVAKEQGFLTVRLGPLRELFLRFQPTGLEIDVDFPDGIGMILHKSSGDFVRVGDLVATIRVAEDQWPSVERQLHEVLTISGTLEYEKGFERLSNG